MAARVSMARGAMATARVAAVARGVVAMEVAEIEMEVMVAVKVAAGRVVRVSVAG